MKKIQLGHSGINVSPVCLGILQFGTRVDEKTGFSILDAYVEAGGQFIDTANNYSMWHAGGVGTESETTLGKWLKERGNREDLVIATKVGFNRADVGPSLSPTTIEKEFAGSMKRMGLDYVDLYYAHADIRTDPLEKTLETFDGFVKKGSVRALGCSNYRAWRIQEARDISRAEGLAEYCCVQQRHTYLRPVPGADFTPQLSSNPDLLDYVRSHDDFRMLAYSPLLNGSYSNREKQIPSQYRDASNEKRIAVLQQVADEAGATLNQVIYAWLMQGDPSIIPLTAPTSVEQLNENLGALKVSLSQEQLDRLSTAGDPE